MIARRTRTSTMTKWQTQHPQDGKDIQDESSSMDSDRAHIRAARGGGTQGLPRPYAGDHRVRTRWLARTYESVSSDSAGVQSDIEEMPCAPAAPNDVLSHFRHFTGACGAQGM